MAQKKHTKVGYVGGVNGLLGSLLPLMPSLTHMSLKLSDFHQLSEKDLQLVIDPQGWLCVCARLCVCVCV